MFSQIALGVLCVVIFCSVVILILCCAKPPCRTQQQPTNTESPSYSPPLHLSKLSCLTLSDSPPPPSLLDPKVLRSPIAGRALQSFSELDDSRTSCSYERTPL